MSTKIYEGLKLKPMNMVTLRKFAEDLRATLFPVHERLYVNLISMLVADIVDKVILSPDDFLEKLDVRFGKAVGMSNPLSIAEYYVRENQQKSRTTMLRDIEADFCNFDCELVVFPVNSRKILALPCVERLELRNVIRSFEGVSEYGYWDDSDKPDEVSEREWTQREKDWNNALPGIGIPDKNGFTLTLTHPNDMRVYYCWERVLEAIPSVQNRAMNHAYNQVKAQISKELKSRDGENGDPFDRADEVRKILKTDEGKTRIEIEAKRLEGILPNITKETLHAIAEMIRDERKQKEAQKESA